MQGAVSDLLVNWLAWWSDKDIYFVCNTWSDPKDPPKSPKAGLQQT